MKKKYVASLLSLCMICTSITPMVYASETADLSAVSDTVFEEELEEKDVEKNTEDMSEVEQDDSDITDEEICIESPDLEEETIIDESEFNAGTQIAEYLDEESESITATYVSDEYTQLKSAPDIEYKYDENTKTLYFKCVDGVKEAKMPDVAEGTSAGATEWLNSMTMEESSKIKKIVIGDGITYIGKLDFSYSGTGCYSNLTEVELPSSVKEIGVCAFQNTSKLATINLENVRQIDSSAFIGSGIKSANLEKAEYIGNTAFDSSKIESVTFGNTKVVLGKSVFQMCSSLKSVKANELVFDDGGYGIFQMCTSLNEFSYTKMENIPSSAFFKTALTSFEFKGVKTIGTGAFTNTAIENIVFDDQIENIESRAFASSKKLKMISINSPNVTIAKDAFTKCAVLEKICYAGTTEQWKNITEITDIATSVTVHCRADKLEAKAPTCTESGLELEDNVCGVCGEHYATGKILDPIGHKFADKYTVDKDATCTEEGKKSKHCTREGCNEKEDIQSIPVDKNNHDWTSEVTTQPTCVKDGVRTLTCSRCKDTKTEVIPATGKHQWSNWKKTADATVFAAEQQERTCTTCGKTETQTVGNKLSATATVNISSVTLKEKQNTSSVKVTGLAKGDSVKSWKSTNTKVFTVTGKADGTCKLTGVKKGSAKLEITMASGLKKTVAVKVQTKTVATSKISGLAKKMTVKKGAKTTLKPVITPATSQQKVTYSSSNKKVAAVSSKGVITAKKAGTAKITVKSGSKKVTVTVTVPKTKTTAITVGKKVSVKKGKTYSLKAKIVPSNSDEKITYSTSNKKIATVSKSGKIKGVKKGTATITIKSGKITKKVKVTVK